MKAGHVAKHEHHIGASIHDKSWGVQQWALEHDNTLKTILTALTLALILIGIYTAYEYQQKAGPAINPTAQNPAATQPNTPEQSATTGSDTATVTVSCAEIANKLMTTTEPLSALTADLTTAKTVCAPSRYEKIVAYKQLQEATK